jgi:hypothetical protein
MRPERRRHERCSPMSSYFLSCYVPGRADRPSLSTKLVDVGPGGVCVATSDRLPLGLRLILEIRIPGEPGRFRAQAVVAWAGDHAAGLRFENVDEDADLPSPADARRPSEPRRRHKRYFPGRGDLSFLPRTLWTSLGFRPRNLAVRIVDLSTGGAHLICAERLTPGDVGDLSFDFSRPRVTLEGEARVVWCRRDTLLLTPEWHVGIAFRRVSDPEAVRTLERHFLG